MSLSSSLLAFRLAYLKMIAKAWEAEGKENNEVDVVESHPESRAPIVRWNPKSKYVEDLLKCPNLLEHDDFIDELPKDQQGNSVELGWPVVVQMMNNVDGPFWAPEHKMTNPHRGWIGPYDRFVIEIPKAPPLEEQSAALAEYYSIFPTLLGGGTQDFSSVSEENSRGENTRDGAFNNAQYGGQANDLGIGGPENLLGFGACVNNIIATAWASEENLKELLSKENNPIKPGQTFGNRMFQFENPWGFYIEFKEGKGKWKNGKWAVLPQNQILLNLPKPPKGVGATALAAYNNSGPAYPYSCI